MNRQCLDGHGYHIRFYRKPSLWLPCPTLPILALFFFLSSATSTPGVSYLAVWNLDNIGTVRLDAHAVVLADSNVYVSC